MEGTTPEGTGDEDAGRPELLDVAAGDAGGAELTEGRAVAGNEGEVFTDEAGEAAATERSAVGAGATDADLVVDGMTAEVTAKSERLGSTCQGLGYYVYFDPVLPVIEYLRSLRLPSL